MKLSIYIVSDSLGKTATQFVRAALSQFNIDDYEIRRFPYVLNISSLCKILEEASKEQNIMLIYTLVDRHIVEYIEEYSVKSNLIAIDLLSPLINGIQVSTNLEPIREPEAIRMINESYLGRLEAI